MCRPEFRPQCFLIQSFPFFQQQHSSLTTFWHSSPMLSSCHWTKVRAASCFLSQLKNDFATIGFSVRHGFEGISRIYDLVASWSISNLSFSKWIFNIFSCIYSATMWSVNRTMQTKDYGICLYGIVGLTASIWKAAERVCDHSLLYKNSFSGIFGFYHAGQRVRHGFLPPGQFFPLFDCVKGLWDAPWMWFSALQIKAGG